MFANLTFVNYNFLELSKLIKYGKLKIIIIILIIVILNKFLNNENHIL